MEEGKETWKEFWDVFYTEWWKACEQLNEMKDNASFNKEGLWMWEFLE